MIPAHQLKKLMSEIDKGTSEDDRAQAAELALTAQAIEAARKSTPEILATGECLFCEAHLPPGVRWCGAECRDDWQKEYDKGL